MGRKPKNESHKSKALSLYLKDKSHTKFAKDVEISTGHLSMILTGKREASLQLVNRIRQHTNEEVSLEDLRPDLYKEILKASIDYTEKRQEEV